MLPYFGPLRAWISPRLSQLQLLHVHVASHLLRVPCPTLHFLQLAPQAAHDFVQPISLVATTTFAAPEDAERALVILRRRSNAELGALERQCHRAAWQLSGVAHGRRGIF